MELREKSLMMHIQVLSQENNVPLYTIRDKNDKEEYNVFISYEELKSLLEEGNIEHVYKPIKIVQGVGGVLSKTDDGWKEVLKKIKKGAGSKSTIKT